ncbi:MAG TPA: metallophosphoesterase family protein [Thermoleophilia bacterium]|nr:metallophosphoesterase family protein [Thermoleophilia bacterium]
MVAFLSARRRARWGPVVRVVLPIALLVVVVVASVSLLSSVSFRVPTGSVDFRLRPAWPGGRLVLPLGPAGALSLRTFRAPLDVIVEYRVSGDVASIAEAEDVVQGLGRIEQSARAAFTRFLWGRLIPLAVLGAAGGALVALAVPRRRPRLRGWRGAVVGVVAGLIVTVVAGGTVAGVALATVDETPAVQYSGLARHVPRLLPLVRQLESADGGGMSRLQAYVDGLETVARQIAGRNARPAREIVTRLLVASDIHMNAYGIRLASRLAAGEGTPVDAVVLAGDMTNFGSRYEARYFVERFDPAGAPVFMVGGNHEDRAAMAAFAGAGYTVLADDLVAVDGVRIYGRSDPLADDPAVDSDVAALARQSASLAAAVRALPEPPDVLAVHDGRQAADVAAWAVEDDVPLTVVYGNSHVPSIRRDGPVVLIDAGTGGASGYEQIGARRGDWYTFVLLDFAPAADGALVAVTTLAYSLDGRSRVEYLPMAE